jgi:hypothetical protein
MPRLAPGFQDALNGFVDGVRALVEEHRQKYFPNLPPEKIEVEVLRRYVRLWKLGSQQRTVFCFVQVDNGDVLKAESWRKPAMHRRSSIYDADYGMSGVTWHGGKYL